MSATDVDPFASLASAEGVPSAFAAARDGIDAILRDRGLRRTTPADTARSLLVGAAASATLEGSPISADALAAGQGDATARGAARLSTELLGLLPVWQQAPLQALARIHALAAARSGPSDEVGRPVDAEGARRLRELALNYLAPTTAPGLVVAALVHAEIATAAPFASSNGVVARAAERLVLLAKGVDPASVTVPEAGHAAAPEAYRAALAAYAGGSVSGKVHWLHYAAAAFQRGSAPSLLSR